MKKTNSYFIAAILLLAGAIIQCSSITGEDDKNNGDWLIPTDEIYEGGPGKDGIPALNEPETTHPSNIRYLNNNDLIIAVLVDGEIRGYPHHILDWHEIINDKIGDFTFSLTYCPLTGSGICWNRNINGEVTSFGVSGLLYNSNLIPYDRLTGSNWSQMMNKSVNGANIGKESDTFPILEMSWSTFKKMYPHGRVVTTFTGWNRAYGTYPYGTYKTDDNLLFRVSNIDSRLPKKERVRGVVINDKSKVYRFSSFNSGTSIVNDIFEGVPLVAAGNSADNFMIIFDRTAKDGTILEFSPLQDSYPTIMIDNEGTRWDAFGRALSGPGTGGNLKPVNSFISYWFAWAAFYPNPEIFK